MGWINLDLCSEVGSKVWEEVRKEVCWDVRSKVWGRFGEDVVIFIGFTGVWVVTHTTTHDTTKCKSREK